jgi:hypothetical protein
VLAVAAFTWCLRLQPSHTCCAAILQATMIEILDKIVSHRIHR